MTSDRDFDRIAMAWLADGPEELSDRVLDAVLDDIHVTRQRHASRLPRRFSLMTTPARVAAAAVIGVLAIGGAFLVLRPAAQVAAPSTNPSPSAAAAACSKPMTNGLPLLDPACRYTSTTEPSFTVGGLEGFYVGNQAPRGTELLVRVPSMKATDLPASVKVIAVENVVTKPCNGDFKYDVNQPTSPWTPTSAAEAPTAFFDWLGTETPLKSDARESVTIDDHAGRTVTYDLDPGFLSDCGLGQGTVFVTDYGSTAPGSSVMCGAHQGTCELWIEDGQATRLTAITVDDQLVLIAVNGPSAIFDEIVAEADKLVATMRFD